jgi:FkbM family methyltransferase
MKILQIGAHKGNDDMTDIIKRYDKDHIEIIILVEPQSQYNNNLLDCYRDYNIKIENLVIVDNPEIDKVNFFRCVDEKDSEISSLDLNHLFKHQKSNYIETEFDCITINNLLEKYNIVDLDILFIDTEGFDDKIIKSIDYDKFNIKSIFYENLHIENNSLIEFLNDKSYSVSEKILSYGWTNNAIKIKN